MKTTKLLLTLFFLLITVLPVASATPPAKFAAGTFQNRRVERTVYITRTGEKYHRGDCRYLSRSKIAIKLSDAKRQGYEPCKVCRP